MILGGLLSSEGDYKRPGDKHLHTGEGGLDLIFGGFFKHEFLRLLLRFRWDFFFLIHIHRLGWVGLGESDGHGHGNGMHI